MKERKKVNLKESERGPVRNNQWITYLHFGIEDLGTFTSFSSFLIMEINFMFTIIILFRWLEFFINFISIIFFKG